MTDDASGDDQSKPYKVGFGRPPKERRFEKGRSGNPKGRPKQQKEQTLKVRNILMEPREVSMKGRVVRMSAGEAFLRSTLEKAMHGHAPSAKIMIHIMKETALLGKESFTPPIDVKGARERLEERFKKLCERKSDDDKDA